MSQVHPLEATRPKHATASHSAANHSAVHSKTSEVRVPGPPSSATTKLKDESKLRDESKLKDESATVAAHKRRGPARKAHPTKSLAMLRANTGLVSNSDMATELRMLERALQMELSSVADLSVLLDEDNVDEVNPASPVASSQAMDGAEAPAVTQAARAEILQTLSVCTGNLSKLSRAIHMLRDKAAAYHDMAASAGTTPAKNATTAGSRDNEQSTAWSTPHLDRQSDNLSTPHQSPRRPLVRPGSEHKLVDSKRKETKLSTRKHGGDGSHLKGDNKSHSGTSSKKQHRPRHRDRHHGKRGKEHESPARTKPDDAKETKSKLKRRRNHNRRHHVHPRKDIKATTMSPSDPKSAVASTGSGDKRAAPAPLWMPDADDNKGDPASFPEIESEPDSAVAQDKATARIKRRQRRNHCCLRYAKNWADTLLPTVVLVAYVLSTLLIKSTLRFVQNEIVTSHILFQADSASRSAVSLHNAALVNELTASCLATLQCSVGDSLQASWKLNVSDADLVSTGKFLHATGRTVNAAAVITASVRGEAATAWFHDTATDNAIVALIPLVRRGSEPDASACIDGANVTWSQLSGPELLPLVMSDRAVECALQQRVSNLVHAAAEHSSLVAVANLSLPQLPITAATFNHSLFELQVVVASEPSSQGAVTITSFSLDVVSKDLQRVDPNATISFGMDSMDSLFGVDMALQPSAETLPLDVSSTQFAVVTNSASTFGSTQAASVAEDPFAYKLSPVVGAESNFRTPSQIDGAQWCVTLSPPVDGVSAFIVPHSVLYCAMYPAATLLATELFAADVTIFVMVLLVCGGLLAITWAPRPKLAASKNWKVLRLHINKLRERHRSMSLRRSAYVFGIVVVVVLLMSHVTVNFVVHFTRTAALETAIVDHIQRASSVAVESFFNQAANGIEMYSSTINGSVLSSGNHSVNVLDVFNYYDAIVTTAALHDDVDRSPFLQRLERVEATSSSEATYSTSVSISDNSVDFFSTTSTALLKVHDAGTRFAEASACLLHRPFDASCRYSMDTGVCASQSGTVASTLECPYSVLMEPFVSEARIDSNWSGLITDSRADSDIVAFYTSTGLQANFTHTSKVLVSRVNEWLTRDHAFSELYAIFLTASSSNDIDTLVAEATSNGADEASRSKGKTLLAYVGSTVNTTGLVAQATASNQSQYIDSLAQIYTLSAPLDHNSGQFPWDGLILTTAFRSIDATYQSYVDVTGMHCMLIYVLCGIIVINLNTGVNREMATVRKLLRRFQNARESDSSSSTSAGDALDRIMNSVHSSDDLMNEMRRLLGGEVMLFYLGARARRLLAKNILTSVANGVRRHIVDIVARELHAAVRLSSGVYLRLYYAVTGNLFHVICEGFIIVHILLIFIEPSNGTLFEQSLTESQDSGLSVISSRQNILLVEAACISAEIVCMGLVAACFGFCCFHPRGLLHSSTAARFAENPKIALSPNGQVVGSPPLSMVRSTPLTVGKIVLVLVCLVDWSCAMFAGSNFRLASRLARVLLLVCWRADLLAIVRVFVTTARKVYSIILLLFVLVIVGAVVGTFLFSSTDGNEALNIWADDFEDFTGTLLTMFTFLCTGENYPSVVVGRVNENPISAFFFIVASFLGVFLITGLLVGYFQEHFGKSLLARQNLALTRQFRFGCALAFLLLDLDDSSRLSRDEFKFFVRDVMIPRSGRAKCCLGACGCTKRKGQLSVNKAHVSSMVVLAASSFNHAREGTKGRAIRRENTAGVLASVESFRSDVDDIDHKGQLPAADDDDDESVDDIALEDALIIDEVFDVISSSVAESDSSTPGPNQEKVRDISFDEFSSILLLWRQYRRFYTIKGLLQGIKYFMRKEHDEYISKMTGGGVKKTPVKMDSMQRHSPISNPNNPNDDSDDSLGAMSGDDDVAIGKQSHRDSVFMETSITRSREMLQFQNIVLTVARSRAFQQFNLVLSLYYAWCMAYLCMLDDVGYKPLDVATNTTTVASGLEFSLVAILVFLAIDVSCRIVALTFTNFWWHHNLNLRRTYRFESSLLVLSGLGYIAAKIAVAVTSAQSDSTQNTTSTFESWLTDIEISEDTPLFFLAFMCFRILTQVQSLRHELVALQRSFGQFSSVLLLLFVVMLLYAILAVEW